VPSGAPTNSRGGGFAQRFLLLTASRINSEILSETGPHVARSSSLSFRYVVEACDLREDTQRGMVVVY
jgi:hypothetical protein